MGAITIRRLDDAVIARIKERAKANGRSMEEEARRLLTDTAKPLSGEEFVERMRRRRLAAFGDRKIPDSLWLLRESREEDPTVSPPDAYGP